MLVADHYLVQRQQLVVDDLFTLDHRGKYWYRGGYNPIALLAILAGGVPAVLPVLLGDHVAAQYSWFIGCGVALVVHLLLSSWRAAFGAG